MHTHPFRRIAVNTGVFREGETPQTERERAGEKPRKPMGPSKPSQPMRPPVLNVFTYLGRPCPSWTCSALKIGKYAGCVG